MVSRTQAGTQITDIYDNGINVSGGKMLLNR